MWNITSRELNSFFSNATGYIVIVIFLLSTSLLLWVFPGDYNILDMGYANIGGLFTLTPWLYLFLCPAVTMKMFAEEKQSGTIELLLTRPISPWKIVCGKALAGWLLVIIALLPTLIWALSVYYISDPVGNMDMGAFWGSWLGLVFLAMVYVCIGLFGSSISKNQIVAFIISALLYHFFHAFYDLDANKAVGKDKSEEYAFRFQILFFVFNRFYALLFSPFTFPLAVAFLH